MKIYNIKNALLWGNCKYHFDQANFNNLKGILHILLGIIESIPLFGQGISLIELAIVKVCRLDKSSKKTQKISRKIFHEIQIKKKQALIYSAVPSLEELMYMIKLDGSSINKEDRLVLNFYDSKLPEINKARIGYELIERKTNSIKYDLNNFKEIQIANNFIKFYDISKNDYQYVVHSTDAKNALTLLKNIKSKKMKNLSFCASLINQDTSFFNQDINLNIAIVLEVDPRNIINTFNRDFFTPSYKPEEGDDNIFRITTDYYNFYEKFNILSGYIDHIYRVCGRLDHHGLNDQKRFLRLLVQKADLEGKKLTNLSIYNELVIELDKLKAKYPNQELHLDPPNFKINSLIKFYENNPELSVSKEEFKIIFDKEGADILGVLEYLSRILKDLKNNNTKEDLYIWREVFNNIQGPSELLSITQTKFSSNISGIPAYNEIDIRIDSEKKRKTRPLRARALLFTESSLKYLKKNNIRLLKEIIKYAQKNNLPLLIT